MKNKIIILVVILVILTELFFLFGNKIVFKNQGKLDQLLSEVTPPVLSGKAIMVEHNRWSQIMEIVGPEKAYKYFKEQYSVKAFGTQHLMAHIMGALLYKKEGIKGQVICDNTFSFGCYHSFFSEALIDKGTSIISELNQICLDKFGPLGSGCQHGIGHGVMDYFGPNRLVDALDSCSETTAATPIAGCTSGVFMEYNVPVLIGDSSAVAVSRPVDPKEPYAPCPSIPKKFQESCYYSIGQWWNQTDFYNNKWKEQGLLCKNIPDKTYMESCFLGIGNITAPDNNFEPDKAIDSCKNMPDQKSIVTCQAGASWSFAANEGYKHLAIKMCGRLGEDDEKECLRLGNMLNPSNK